MHWWINLVVLAITAVVYVLLQYFTRPLRADENAVEDKPEHLTV